MSYSKTSPEALAEQVISNINMEINYSLIPTDGAQRAVCKIKEFLALQP